MDYKFAFIVLAIGVTVAGIIPLATTQSPEDAYMEIDMLVGQTQNPFRIQDDTDTDVFCINSSGEIACGGYHITELFYASEVEYSFSNSLASLPTDTTTGDPSILAQWHIDTGTVTDWELFNVDSLMTAQMKEDSGAGGCNLRVQGFEGGTWGTFGGSMTASTGSGTYVPISNFKGESLQTEVTDVRTIVFAGTTTTCTVQFIDTNVRIHVPNYFTITRTK